MALLWIEGFETYGSTLDSAPSPVGILARRYAASAAESASRLVDGRVGGRAYKLGFFNGGGLTSIPFSTTDSEMFVGFSLKYNLGGYITKIFSLYDGSSEGVTITLGSTGQLSVHSTGAAPELLGTTVLSLVPDVWSYIEMGVDTHASAGTVTIHVNGSLALNLSGEDTQGSKSNAWHDAFRLWPHTSSGPDIFFDDIYVLDGSGSSQNSRLGPQRVDIIIPDGDSVASDDLWDRSTGSDGYALVDDGRELNTGDYVHTDVAEKQMFTYAALSASVNAVNGIAIITDVDMESGTMGLTPVIRSNSVDTDGTPIGVVSGGYVTHTYIAGQDPYGGSPQAWDAPAVNAAEFGFKSTL